MLKRISSRFLKKRRASNTDNNNSNDLQKDKKIPLRRQTYAELDKIIKEEAFLLEHAEPTKDVKARRKSINALLNKKYKNAYPKGTPLVCACEFGNFDELKKRMDSNV